MTVCERCGALRFVTCREPGHGDWCARCEGLSCPRCQAGLTVLELLTPFAIAALVVFSFWAPELLR